MSTATNKLVRTLSEINPDELPQFSSVKPIGSDAVATDATSGFFSSITWQTWLIIILILAFLGINVFAYLEKGTDATTNFFDKFIVPILKVFGGIISSCFAPKTVLSPILLAEKFDTPIPIGSL